jgi:rod shape-determining protein MreC
VTKRNNYFTLNIGRIQGVKRGMGVFSDNGVVGIIHNVSDHFAVVKSVLTENINIDVMIEPIGLFGLLKWDGRDPRRGSITGISNDLKIKKWSKVVTRGGSGIFPRGIMVGRVGKLKPVEGKPLWDVEIRFSEDYRTLQRVYIIKNLMQEEQEKLEAAIPEDKEE